MGRATRGCISDVLDMQSRDFAHKVPGSLGFWLKPQEAGNVCILPVFQAELRQLEERIERAQEVVKEVTRTKSGS